MDDLQDWPEPVTPVQSLSGLCTIPDRYIKPLPQRASPDSDDFANDISIPVIDLNGLHAEDSSTREAVAGQIASACKEWGFFQAINHGVSEELMDRAREAWRQFFHLPMEIKRTYSNSPKTYEGYGSRLGTQKGALLDWGDYYYLHYLPLSLKDCNKWPALPHYCREVFDEYGKALVKLCERLMKLLSVNLGLREDQLQNAFGGGGIGACLRVNYYPKCPQPELTLGLSSHSDPGGLTLLLADEEVLGLQVRKDNEWMAVKPAKHAFIVNVGDQIQVLSNAIYRSVEHRVTASSNKERLSLAFFYNPKSDVPIEPLKELVTPDRPALYQPMTFEQYRLFIRTKGPHGKSHLASLQRQ